MAQHPDATSGSESGTAPRRLRPRPRSPAPLHAATANGTGPQPAAVPAPKPAAVPAPTALTPAGLQRLREHALKHKPWRFSTGPTTAAGKARMAANGKKRQIGPRSVREIRADLADLRDLMDQMRASAQMASKSS